MFEGLYVRNCKEERFLEHRSSFG